MKKDRVILLDVLRVFAVGLVIVGHLGSAVGTYYGMFFGIPHFYYVSLGGVGVTLFLILSGIVLEMTYGYRKYSYFDFVLHRVRRIYGVYWMALLFTIIAASILKTDLHLDWQKILSSFSGFQAFLGHPYVEFINAGGWFIGVIVFMYLLYPLLSKLVKLNSAYFIIGLMVISVVFRAMLGWYWRDWYRPQDWFPLCRVFEFGLGIWLVYAGKIEKLPKINIRWQRLFGFLGEISFPLYLVHIPLLVMINSQSKPIVLFALIAVGVSIVIYCLDSWINEIVRNKRIIIKS